MNIWHDIDPALITPDRFMAVIEIKRGGKNKYEMDKATGLLRLDRVLYTSTHYPANYGFIPRTYADDGDPLDVLVLCSEAIEPMTLVECRPIGMLRAMAIGIISSSKMSRCGSSSPQAGSFSSPYRDGRTSPPPASRRPSKRSRIALAVSSSSISGSNTGIPPARSTDCI